MCSAYVHGYLGVCASSMLAACADLVCVYRHATPSEPTQLYTHFPHHNMRSFTATVVQEGLCLRLGFYYYGTLLDSASQALVQHSTCHLTIKTQGSVPLRVCCKACKPLESRIACTRQGVIIAGRVAASVCVWRELACALGPGCACFTGHDTPCDQARQPCGLALVMVLFGCSS